MELGAHVWLRSESSPWGWVPALIRGKEETVEKGVPVIHLTLTDDQLFEGAGKSHQNHDFDRSFLLPSADLAGDGQQEPFRVVISVDPEELKAAEHDDIKLRNVPSNKLINGANGRAVVTSPSKMEDSGVVGGVDDLIGLTHLHEPAILHALRLRYDSDIIYTSTGPILIAVNPFKSMKDVYSDDVMEKYRQAGEGNQELSSNSSNPTPFKRRTNDFLHRRMQKNVNNTVAPKKLSPHVYQIADDAYRTMQRGLENRVLLTSGPRNSISAMPTNQSILVSGESGAGKTVTTKIVLNYFAMLSQKAVQTSLDSSMNASYVGLKSPTNGNNTSFTDEDVTTEKQVLKSNPILESFGNARTIRNDNSSRFGKYIDIQFTQSGRLSSAQIDTYLLEKVRLIHPSEGERNYHVFYQFLSSATKSEREQFYLDDMNVQDFKLLNQTGGTYDRRDGVSDEENHHEMLDAMITLGFQPEVIQSLMRLVVGVLFAGNMSFASTSVHEDTCCLLEDHASLAVSSLFGVTFEELDAALTTRTITAGIEVLHKQLSHNQALKANEALIKAIYGAAFDFIVKEINDNISQGSKTGVASIGVLDIFGFETFGVNNFEQLCINYTNEALQQQFNKFVFKLEQQEYEKEGILWKFITFPDNQDVLDLIDAKHTGILAILDEQCIVPQATDQKFTWNLYSKCGKHARFSTSAAQKVDFKFSIEHYAGPVEYSTDAWLEKNKDQLPATTADLLDNSTFSLIGKIKSFTRAEARRGKGSVVFKSVGYQFATQLRQLRNRIDITTPHYIRCLKPNDDLVPDYFDPKNIVEQLRCGGVLEAVRVSRAGFPTRYPHDVFLARYYILGNRKDLTPMSPMHGKRRHENEHEEELKRLITKIAFDIWYSDHQTFLALMEAEKKEMEWEKQTHDKKSHNTPVTVYTKGSKFVGGPQSLATVSSNNTTKKFNNNPMMLTPNRNRNQKKNNRVSKELSKKFADAHKIAQPESESDYMELDFVSRCAVAGIQLGRSKVFLRREAFDRIEAMRSQAFIWSASTIQAMVRGKIYRERFKAMRCAAIQIQAVARGYVTKRVLERQILDDAAIKIQSAWRMASARYSVYKCYLELKDATIVIQRFFRRCYLNRNINTAAQNAAARTIQARVRGVIARNMFFSVLYGIIKLQSVSRGKRVRNQNLLLDATIATSIVASELPVVDVNDHSVSRTVTPQNKSQTAPFALNPNVQVEMNDLYKCIHDEEWAKVEAILDEKPEMSEQEEPSSGELPLHIIARHPNAWTLLVDMILVLYPKALIHRDRMGALPIHHAAAHDNIGALEIIHSAYKEGINDYDLKGRLPLHVAAEFDAAEAIKFLLANSPEGAFTMVHRPTEGDGGGLPLHVACRNYASIGSITALLSENFAAAKKCDENGDLPLHLLLRCGDVVDQVVVKTLLTCFSGSLSRTDMNGDLPLTIAIKHQCKPEVINTVLMPFTDAAKISCGQGHTPLHLAFENGADDRTILGLLNHAPDLAVVADKRSGLLPIQVATEHEHSHFIVHNLLKRDMPIDIQEKVRAQLLPHNFSWNHVVSQTEDMYYQVVNKVLSQCTQPQVLALAHVEGPDGKIALASATPVCKHELRVMLRLFNTLEVVNQRPAYTNPISDTQIFYALRYEPPATQSNTFTILHEDKKDAINDLVEDFDDNSIVSAMSKHSVRSAFSTRSQQSIEQKLKTIKKERGQQVIAKLTSRSDIVERELKVRKEYQISRHYVPAVISVHHTVQHAAYSEAMAEPGYCITMEGADTTAENLMLDSRRSGKQFPTKALKRIGISLLHMHEHGLVHCDFGTHNIGKFGSRWKLLGVGGSVPIGQPTDPNRGFYHPPESIIVESKRAPLGKKAISACVVSVPAYASYDIWAYGVVIYEAVCGVPLSPYACRGKRSMSAVEVSKIGKWDDYSLKKALRNVSDSDEDAKDLIKCILHPDPEKRLNSMRDVLEHSFFQNATAEQKQLPSRPKSSSSQQTRNSESENVAPSQIPQTKSQIVKERKSLSPAFDGENLVNGVVSRPSRQRDSLNSVQKQLSKATPNRHKGGFSAGLKSTFRKKASTSKS